MSKISNAFQMIKLLSNGRVYTVKELSNTIGISERMIRYYKEQLELSGYIIESFKGPKGGYYINKNNIINIDYFNKYDLEVLDRVKDKIKNTKDEKLIKDYNELNNKLHSIYNTNKILSEYKEIDINIEENNDKLNTINKCIKEKNSLSINYLGKSGKIISRKIIPIYIFEFEDNIYITAFCNLRGAIRHFNIKNILSIKII